MTWDRTAGEAHRHPKLRKLRTPDAVALWFIAKNICADFDTDGLLTVDGLEDALHYSHASDPDEAVAAIVRADLWHDRRTIRKCSKCVGIVSEMPSKRLGLGEHYIHDWTEYQLSKAGKNDSIERQTELRDKALHRDKRLCAAIRNRDRDMCRYCGQLTKWRGDRRSELAGTYDHVDPFLPEPNTYENVVVCCKSDNERKGRATPDMAGMKLLEPPGTNPPADLARSGSGEDADQENQAPSREGGTGRSGPGTGQDGAGRSGDGSGPGSDLKDPTEGGAGNG